ncbi:MAG: COG4280 domain-containing protein [Acidimicrobiales bacterium]
MGAKGRERRRGSRRHDRHGERGEDEEDDDDDEDEDEEDDATSAAPAPGGAMSTTSTVVLLLAVFGACCVEAVEALTIVLAAGTTRGWRSALEGAGVAVVVLGVLVGAVGAPLIHYVPIDALRVLVGALLLVLGLSWLRKAILRASGHKSLHDEDAIYAATTAELLRGEPSGSARPARDRVGFAVAFKGVFLEGMEVVFIVISLGASQHRLGAAALAAVAAIVVVTGAGALVARQLSMVPENTIKIVVGIMLTSFGLFWTGEGAGVHWPGSDLAIPVLIGAFAVVTLVGVILLRPLAPGGSRPAPAPAVPADTSDMYVPGTGGVSGTGGDRVTS